MKYLQAKDLPKEEGKQHKMQPGVREDQRGMLRGSRNDLTPGNVSGVTSEKTTGARGKTQTKPAKDGDVGEGQESDTTEPK